MALETTIYGNRRVTVDSHNPRIYIEEWKCAACGKWIDSEDEVWINPETTEATTGDQGAPFHVDCAPEEDE